MRVVNAYIPPSAASRYFYLRIVSDVPTRMCTR